MDSTLNPNLNPNLTLTSHKNSFQVAPGEDIAVGYVIPGCYVPESVFVRLKS